MNIRKYYNKEDLKTDVDWLNSYGIDKTEAEKFVKHLLLRVWEE